MNELLLGILVGMVIMWSIKDSLDDMMIKRAKKKQGLINNLNNKEDKK